MPQEDLTTPRFSYVVGNLLQGFSSGGWKEQHNIHHAATNIVGRDGDLDLLPLWATVVQDLKVGLLKAIQRRLGPSKYCGVLVVGGNGHLIQLKVVGFGH